jgi:hypothetical protein
MIEKGANMEHAPKILNPMLAQAPLKSGRIADVASQSDMLEISQIAHSDS